MKRSPELAVALWMLLSIMTPNLRDARAQEAPAPTPAALPTVFIARDSTAAAGNPDAVGWGKPLVEFFDPARVNVANRARDDSGSHTFVSERFWERLLAEVKAGDYVLIQFGHNDNSLPGLGEETQDINNPITHQPEIVHTFGWYLRKIIADTKAKGARPILMSPTVRNIWKDSHVERGSGQYGQWSWEVAKAERVPFVDVTKIIADHYEQMGQAAVGALFPHDPVHTGEAGAKLNAGFITTGLRGLRDQTLIRYLSAQGRLVPTASPDNVAVVSQPPQRGAPPAEFTRWLNLPEPGDPALPTLLLIGDSTVRNGRGNGYDGQFGWGDPLENWFDPAKINVVNRAVGGLGARTFITGGHWERALPLVKPGDVVMMQFGHNDNGARGALKGGGEETQEQDNPTTNQKETVQTFGWYIRKYIADIRAKGATPVVCSLIPRNTWKDGKVARGHDTHADWARAAAESEKAPFVDLYEIIAQRYDALGQTTVAPLFADGHVHTGWPGAVLNAECVVAGLNALPQNPLKAYYAAVPPAPFTPPAPLPSPSPAAVNLP